MFTDQETEFPFTKSITIHSTHTLQAKLPFEHAVERLCGQGALLTNKPLIHLIMTAA